MRFGGARPYDARRGDARRIAAAARVRDAAMIFRYAAAAAMRDRARLACAALSRPTGLVAQRERRLARLRDDLPFVIRGELAGTAQDAAVDHHGVDVRRQGE